MNIVGSTRPILDESDRTGCGNITSKVRKLFQIKDHEPEVEEALSQLLVVCKHFFKRNRTPSLMRVVNGICKDIYSFLQKEISDEDKKELIQSTLKDSSWIFVQDRFVKSEQIAFEWDGYGAPYLYRVPKSLDHNRKLLKDMGVKRSFDIQDILSALKEMKTDNERQRLDNAKFKVAKAFLDELSKLLAQSPEKMHFALTPIPDHNGILRFAKELIINDAPWVKIRDDAKYIHKDISIDLAYKLGAKDVRSKGLEDILKPVGQPFGQKENLTDRLSGILKTYPCDFGILKELLQNADDAKATEIHFIYDPRYHSGKRLFNDSWNKLQGPALCVYNDRPFSDKDLEGIQRLGIGSKADSPEKTGQYGIGFNAVYHLTDCPSFITDGNILCILDPHARYAPGATKQNPGRLIGPFEAAHRANYRDVFSGYLGDMFALKGATMFRFPLRNKEMARKSDISQKEVLSLIDSLLLNFKDEAKETLIFLNYVKTISISKIEEGKLRLMYKVTASLKSEDELKRRKLAVHVKNAKYQPTSEMKKFGIFYQITLKDIRSEEKWLVQQTIGADCNKDEIPDGKDNGLLLRAGVAVKMTASRQETAVTRSKAFCFLPLPVTTGLPLHVNGHFALDSGRRGLWQDEDEETFNTRWNRFIKEEVIADAYVNLMLEAREHIPNLKHDGQFDFSHSYQTRNGLEWYEGLFPSQSQCESQWKDLTVSVLNKIDCQHKHVLPLLQERKKKEGVKHVCKWFSTSESFFSNSDCGRSLSEILRNLGFNLVSLTYETFKTFKDANTKVKEVTPEQVLKFLSNHKPVLEQLPCPLADSSFESAEHVLKLLNYCMKSPKFVTNLEGVPLSITRDGMVRVFSKQHPIYITKFSNLVPSPAENDKFAKMEIATALSPKVCQEIFYQSPKVALQLNLASLVTFFPLIFQESEIWSKTSIPVFWKPEKEDREIRIWLKKLWSFISKKHEENPSDCFLEPLKNWPVIPIKSGYLFPVSLSKTVVNLTESDSWSTHQRRIVQALQDVRCPEVDIELMESKGDKVSGVLKPYLAYPNTANDVATVLDSLMKTDGDISGRIDANTATFLLQFLQDDSDILKTNIKNLSVFRKLPFYKTIGNRLIKLEGASFVCKLPHGIPLEESHVWMEGTRNIFLEPVQSLNLLHQLLGVELKSHASCYIDFIFPRFSRLKESTRITHLSYIKDNLFNASGPDTARLETALQDLKFVPHVQSRELHTASHYYDPRNKVFKAMLSKDTFPGKPFCQDDWISFLCQIGLRRTFDKNLFLDFARDVEREGEGEVTKALIKKSQVLIKYLLHEKSLHQPKFLNNVSQIKFVVPHKAEEKHTSLIKQHLFEDESVPPLIPFKQALASEHEVMVWGSAALLPDWALPSDRTVREGLGILDEPTLQQVKSQVQKLSEKFASKDFDLKQSISKLLLDIMSKTYDFLQNKMHHSNFEMLFRGVPLVLVESGRVFVRCEQLAFEMQNCEEQPPYLYKVPREFGQFDPLFKRLGVFEKPSPSQYAFILETFWTQSKGQELHAEEIRNVEKAVRGLFRTLKRLRKDDEDKKTTMCLTSLDNVKILYLPNDKKHLKPSNGLYHASPMLLKRINKAEFPYDMLFDLSEILHEHERQEDVLAYLPPHLQVTSLSDVLVEEIQADCFARKCTMDETGNCQMANLLRKLLKSVHLKNGVTRILKSQDRSVDVNNETRTKIERLSTVFKIVCLESLETVLKNVKGKEAHGGKISKKYFTKDEETNTCVFIQHGAEHFESSVSYEVCLAVNKRIGNAVNRENLAHLESIILYGWLHLPAEIPSVLDSRGIDSCNEQSANNETQTAELGSLIPQELHYLLIQNLDFLFRPEEIVGYEQEDSKDDEQGKYVYARIVREIAAPKKAKKDSTRKRKAQNPFHRKYLIDDGSGTYIEVDALDLYKLKRPEELNDPNENTTMPDCQDIAPYSGEEQPAGASAPTTAHRPSIPHTWEKAVKEIDKALADIMKLPKEQRKKALKRLYLRWHPDKNPGMEKLATKVVQYMQNEFSRLSDGRGVRASTSADSKHGDDDLNGSFRNWDQKAKRQRASYDNYRRNNPGFTRNFPSGCGFTHTGSGGHKSDDNQSSHSFGASCNTNNASSSYNPPNAKMSKMWLIQCRSDLGSVEHLFSSNTSGGFYWLICFQCSQVVEKALKGALYGVSGISESQLESHDLTSLAYHLKRLPRAPDVVHFAGKLWKYHDAARYPHKHCPAKPPKDVYTVQQAQEAYEIAKSVLKEIEEFIGHL